MEVFFKRPIDEIGCVEGTECGNNTCCLVGLPIRDDKQTEIYEDKETNGDQEIDSHLENLVCKWKRETTHPVGDLNGTLVVQNREQTDEQRVSSRDEQQSDYSLFGNDPSHGVYNGDVPLQCHQQQTQHRRR